jgi:hypothetical protein
LTNTFSVADIPVSPEFLKPPFPFMLIEMPPYFSISADKEGKQPLSDILVCFDKEPSGEDILLIIGSTNSDSGIQLVYSFLFGEGATIQEDIELFVRRRSHHMPKGIEAGAKGASQKEEASYQIINFVCNFLLYCASFPNDVLAHNAQKLKKLQDRLRKQRRQGSGKLKATRRKLHRARNDSVYIVGKNFRLDDSRVHEELSHNDGRKLKVRHIVRGHWRNQACGPRHQERKLTFIQPHYRGTGKEGPKKTYVVK